MTGPAVETQAQRLARLEAEAELASVSGSVGPSKGRLMHQAAQSGPKGMARLKQNIADQNAADRPDFLEKVVGTADAAAQEIPGVEAVGTALRSAIHGEPYKKSLSDLRTAESEAPPLANVGARLAAMAIPAAGLSRLAKIAPAGGSAVARLASKLIPNTAAKGGALLGGALPALAADDESLGARAGWTAVGAGTGGLFGKLMESLGTVNRTKSVEPIREGSDIVAKDAARTAASDPAFAEFRALGNLGPDAPPPPRVVRVRHGGEPVLPRGTLLDVHGEPMPRVQPKASLAQQNVKNLIDLPIIKKAIAAVKGESPTLSKLPDTDAAVLAEAHRIIGNAAWRASNGFTKGEAADALAGVMEASAGEKGGSFEKALSAFREPSKRIAARLTGAQTLRTAATGKGAPLTEEGMLAKTPAAYRTAYAEADAPVREELTTGVLQELKQSPKNARLPWPLAKVPVPGVPSKALTAAKDLLRQTEGPRASRFVRDPHDLFQKLLDLLETGQPGQTAGRLAKIGSGPDDE